MEESQKILLVINNPSTVDTTYLQQWAQTLPPSASLSLLLVKEDTSAFFAAFSPSYTIQAQKIDQEARIALTRTGAALGIQPEHQWLATGNCKTEAKRLAKQLQAELVYASTLTPIARTEPMTPFMSRFGSFIRMNT